MGSLCEWVPGSSICRQSLCVTSICVLLLLVSQAALGIENKCGACVVVQHELMDILTQERPKGPLDMRNRLNSQGKREGKVIDYKNSELRIIQILESLCEKTKKYSLMTPGKEKKRIWMRDQKLASDRLQLIAEEQGKELKRWCDRMIEEYEEDMAAMIREEVKTAYGDVPIILCRNMTGNCKDEETYLAELKRTAEHWQHDTSTTLPKGMPKIDVKVHDTADEKQQDAENSASQGKQEEQPKGDNEEVQAGVGEKAEPEVEHVKVEL